MPIDLLASIFVGGFFGGFVWLVYKARRRRAPRYLIPLVIGAGILGYTIWNEYSWATRTTAALPPDIVVIDELTYRSPLQPWTYIIPRVNRLIAIDRANLRRNERLPGAVLAELLLFERLTPTRRVVQIIDCTNGRRADVTSDARFLEGELPAEASWAALRRDSPLLVAVCGG